MSKGRIVDFLGFYEALVKEGLAYFPTSGEEFDRDIKRLRSLSRIRGSMLFTIDLPALGKILDQSLATGVLGFSGEPLSRSSKRSSTIPRLFRVLWSHVFDDAGCLQQSINPSVVELLRTFLYGAKRVRMECPPKALFSAIREYFDDESDLPPIPDYWNGAIDDTSPYGLGSLRDLEPGGNDQGGMFRRTTHPHSQLLDTLQRVADVVSSSFPLYNPEDWKFRHGPGAVFGFQRGKKYKYDFHCWSPTLQHVFPPELFAFHNEESYRENCDAGKFFIEEPSQLISVPKTQKSPRLIAKEPLSNQWCQQNVRDYLYHQVHHGLLRNTIDFTNQGYSQDLAIAGSLDGSISTIDLKSASDRLSCYLVQRIFRANHSLLRAFRAVRTRFLVQEYDKKSPSFVRLRKFSTQGSALTFPVQSIVFSIIACGTIMHNNGLRVTTRNVFKTLRQVRVFGDDIIVPNQWGPQVVEALELCLLKVNRSKTFTVGNFRESCGADAFQGTKVNPGYILEDYDRTRPSSIASIVDTHNNFVKKKYWHVAAWLRSTLPRAIVNMLPEVEVGDGILGLQGHWRNYDHLKSRWNEKLQRREYLVLAIKAKARTSKHESVANLLQFFTEGPNPLILWESGKYGNALPVIGKSWVVLPN